MKTMCPPGYHHNGFVETHALGHMMYGCAQVHVPKSTSCAQVHELPQSHCGTIQHLKFFTRLHKSRIYKSHLVKKGTFKLFTTREL